MSFSFTKSAEAPEALIAVHTDTMLPECIKEYLVRGINALQQRYDDNVKLDVSAYGHLFNGQEGYCETTDARLSVQKSNV